MYMYKCLQGGLADIFAVVYRVVAISIFLSLAAVVVSCTIFLSLVAVVVSCVHL